MDSDVYAVVQKYMQQEDFTALQQEVQTKYNEALTADANLANMIQSTLDGAIKQWAASINTIQDTTEGSTEVTPDTEAPVDDGTAADDTTADGQTTDDGAADQTTDAATTDDTATDDQTADNQTAEDTTAQEETPSTWTVQTTDGVNIRNSASTDGDKLGRCDMGTRFTAVGTEGEWTKVEYREQIGYIKTEFLETVN